MITLNNNTIGNVVVIQGCLKLIVTSLNCRLSFKNNQRENIYLHQFKNYSEGKKYELNVFITMKSKKMYVFLVNRERKLLVVW